MNRTRFGKGGAGAGECGAGYSERDVRDWKPQEAGMGSGWNGRHLRRWAEEGVTLGCVALAE